MKKWFKIYFWFICLFIIYVTYTYLDDGIPLDLLDYIDWIFTIITLSGVYAYCYSKSFLKPEFWKNYLRVVVVWDIYFISSSLTEDTSIYAEEFGLTILVLVAIFYFLLLLPGYIALYLLAKDCDKDGSFEMKA